MLCRIETRRFFAVAQNDTFTLVAYCGPQERRISRHCGRTGCVTGKMLRWAQHDGPGRLRRSTHTRGDRVVSTNDALGARVDVETVRSDKAEEGDVEAVGNLDRQA